MISYLNFNSWKEQPVTKAFMKYIQEELQGPKTGLPSWEDVKDPNRLAYKMGLIDAFERVLNITKEELIDDEGESH